MRYSLAAFFFIFSGLAHSFLMAEDSDRPALRRPGYRSVSSFNHGVKSLQTPAGSHPVAKLAHQQPHWLVIPITLRVRAFMPRSNGFKIDGVRVNYLRRSWEAMFAVRPVFSIPKLNLRVMTGGEYHIGTTGSYALVSRSFTTHGGHVGIGLLGGFRLGSMHIWSGLLARRKMEFANDLPPGKENKEIAAIMAAYQKANPGKRTLYYNQYGPAIFVEGGDRRGSGMNWKGELFLHSPLGFAPLTVIPGLNVGKVHVAVGLLVFEVEDLNLAAAGRMTVKIDWVVHSPGAKYAKARFFADGAGGVTVRKKITYLQPNGSIWLEAGAKQELDPTGFIRNRAFFAGLRMDGLFFK